MERSWYDNGTPKVIGRSQNTNYKKLKSFWNNYPIKLLFSHKKVRKNNSLYFITKNFGFWFFYGPKSPYRGRSKLVLRLISLISLKPIFFLKKNTEILAFFRIFWNKESSTLNFTNNRPLNTSCSIPYCVNDE